jgi:signal transduction histidine kinase
VRQFLDYTWMKSGRPLTVSPRAADVLPIVEDVAEVQSAFGPIEIETEEALPPAQVDPDRLHQVLMSLVSNAVKFSPAGSPARISVCSGDESVEISVSDTGPGIEPEELRSLFDEDSAGEGPEGTEPGSGLGLYLARSLTEPQGGRINVTSRPGEGSCFTIVLPRSAGSG